MLLETTLGGGITSIIEEFFTILVEVIILPVTLTVAFATILSAILSILIFAVIMVVLFYCLIRYTKPTLKEAGIIIGMAFVQTICFSIFLVILFFFRLEVEAISLTQDYSYLTTLQISCVFMILIFIADIQGELIRNIYLKHKFKLRWVAFIVSIVQTLFFLFIVYYLTFTNILQLRIINASGAHIGFLLEGLLFFCAILISELIIEFLRTRFF